MVSIALALHARGIGSVLTSVGAFFGHGQLGRPRANVQLKVATAPSPSQVDDLQATIAAHCLRTDAGRQVLDAAGA